MKISTTPIEECCNESDIYNRLLPLDGKRILELGCGSAEVIRRIASAGTDRHITALEVDLIAHRKNLQTSDLPNVRFMLGGAQQIPLEDESLDVVFMFKSLHHVPTELMDQSLQEIRRVLKPGGYVYISEPIAAGDFNDILRLFHDEEKVRAAAFESIKRAVQNGLFTLQEEVFFNSPRRYKDFAEFERRIINATYARHELDEKLYARVKRRFERHLDEDGARFLKPNRVDLLRRLS